MIASPEKALFDKIAVTAGVVFRSRKSTMSYLLEDLRIDEDRLKSFDTTQMSSWQPDAPKKDSLSMLINTIKSL